MGSLGFCLGLESERVFCLLPRGSFLSFCMKNGSGMWVANDFLHACTIRKTLSGSWPHPSLWVPSRGLLKGYLDYYYLHWKLQGLGYKVSSYCFKICIFMMIFEVESLIHSLNKNTLSTTCVPGTSRWWRYIADQTDDDIHPCGACI